MALSKNANLLYDQGTVDFICRFDLYVDEFHVNTLKPCEATALLNQIHSHIKHEWFDLSKNFYYILTAMFSK